MTSPRIVSIIGATGLQGSSVLEALLVDGTFTPRAITRTPDSDASIKLKSRGVEVVKADTSDKPSLLNALRGSECVFVVTLSTSPTEIVDGKNIVDAAKEVAVKFIVFSSVPGVTTLSGGKYTDVKAYDDKEIIEKYLQASGIANASLHLGGFMETLWTYGYLRKTDTGYNISLPYSPTALEAWTWVRHDVGESALALFKSYTDPNKDVSGKAYPVVTANMTFPAFAAMLSKSLGVEVTFTQIQTTGIPMVDGMLKAQEEYNGFFAEIPVPNPDLVKLGVKFGTPQEFIETEIKKRFGK